LAFLRREYLVLLPFLVVVGGLLAVVIGAKTGVADGFGGLCSIAAGWIGMQGATLASVRTTEAARTSGQAAALRVAFGGGSGATVTGVMLALFMANAGGAWDNAKKYGPAMNILVKLMSVVALVLAPWLLSFGK
jgi:Na+/H+-translocating membrane pyrophosphatase